MERNSVNRNLQRSEGQLEGAEQLLAKNKYTTPHLVEYGTLAKPTRTGAGVVTEGSMGSTGCL